MDPLDTKAAPAYPDCPRCGHNTSGVVAYHCTTFVPYPEGDPRGMAGYCDCPCGTVPEIRKYFGISDKALAMAGLAGEGGASMSAAVPALWADQGGSMVAAVEPVPADGPASASILLEHITECTDAKALVVVDGGSADDVIASMVAAGWTLDERVDHVAGKRIRFVTPPDHPINESRDACKIETEKRAMLDACRKPAQQ